MAQENNNSIDELVIQIDTESKNASDGLKELISLLKELNGIVPQSAKGLSNTAKDISKVADSTKKSDTSTLSFSRTLRRTWAVVDRVADAMGSWFEKTNNYVENLNLFRVAMGENADEALKFANNVQSLIGIDISEWLQSQGSFNQMLLGFGLASDKAAQMSQQLTQITYDLSSLWNVDVETAMQKVQSGISGQIKGLKVWGINLSIAQLKETALAHGITLSTSKMTEAQKATLRYVTLMEKTVSVQNDLARTILTPANAMRILKAQIEQMGRALGQIVSVIAVKVIPIAQALVSIITDVAKALASLLGYKLPEIDYSGIQGAGGSAEDLSDDLADATGNAKKLKNAMLGFDELNVIAPDTDSGSGSGNGYADDFGIDLSKYDYDFLKGLEQQSDELKGKIKGILILLASMLTTITIMKGITNLPEILKNVAAVKATLGGISTGGLLATAGVVAMLSLRFYDLLANSKMFRKGIEATIGTIAKVVKAISKGVDSIIGDVKRTQDAFDVDIFDFIILGIGGIIAFIGSPVLGTAVLVFEGISLALRAIGYAASDSIEQVELFEGISKETATKVQPLTDSLTDLTKTFDSLYFNGEIISDETVSSVKEKTSAISTLITDELQADLETSVSNFASLQKTLGDEAYNNLLASNNKYYQDRIAKVKNNEKQINDIVAKASSEQRGLRADELQKINELQAEMQDIGIQQLTDNEVEYETIMRRMKDNTVAINVEQASEIIQNAAKTRDETLASAEDMYSRQLLEAQRMLDVGAINQETYDQIVAAAQLTKEESINSANEQYQGIYDAVAEKLGDTSKYIDDETGKIKTKWAVFTDGLKNTISNAFTSAKEHIGLMLTAIKDNIVNIWETIKQWFLTNVAPKFTKEFWIEKFSGMKDAFVNTIKNAVNSGITLFNGFIDWVNLKLNVSWDSVNILGEEVIPAGSFQLFTIPHIPLFAEGGYPDAGQLFVAREAGAELVGNIGGKTGVANNDQIIQGIKQAVLEAMNESNSGESGSVYEVKVYLDGKQIKSSIEQTDKQQGVSIMKGGIVYGTT